MQKYTLKTLSRDHQFSVNYQQELNSEQLEVVMSGDGPLLVIAGAGSGKTRTLTYRVARLIESGVNPATILLVTFTNKASKEMLHRVELLISMNTRKLWGGTFHHIANRILRSKAHLLDYDNNFTILDREDSKELLNTCIADLGINTKEKRFPQATIIQDVIGLSVNTQASLENIIADRYPFFFDLTDEIQSVSLTYHKRKKKNEDVILNRPSFRSQWLPGFISHSAAWQLPPVMGRGTPLANSGINPAKAMRLRPANNAAAGAQRCR